MLQLPDLRIDNIVLGAAACLAVGAIARVYLDNRLPLPPSPPTWRLKGHLFPKSNSFLTIARWIDEYGPLITVRSGTVKTVYIGRHKAAVDIMEKQGALIADRPGIISAGELLSGGQSIALTRTGERLRHMRRALHSHLQPKAAESYEPVQFAFAKDAVLDLLDESSNFQHNILTFTASIITKIAYGKTTRTLATDPEVVDVRRRFLQLAKASSPGAYLVDSFSWLKYVPGYGRQLTREFERGKKFYVDLLKGVKQQLQSNVDVLPSFVKYMLENPHLYPAFTETEVAFLAGAFLIGGSHSTAAGTSTVIMTAACFPEEQAAVQAEIDAVIGSDRVPTFADEKSLPRLCAFILECNRWRPSAPEAIAHQTTKDVIWENYCIPAGTPVIASQWAISRDTDFFPDPDAFKPARWLDDQGGLRTDLKAFSFGFGRRVCPGQHLAKRATFIYSACVLWAFHLTVDRTKPLNDMGYMTGVIPDVQPCTVEFKTRIPESELRRMFQNDS